MTRTLVIQLGRLGDVIQTTPLLADFASRGDQVDVLVLHSVHTALLGCPAVANVIAISDALKPLDDAIAFGFPHRKIPAEAFDLLAALRLPLYDRIINASHAPLGCWLAAEIPCADPSARYGGIIRDGECLYLGAASAYRIAMLQFREQNLFNVVDLIRAIPGILPQNAQPRLYAKQSSELLFALPRGRGVALNPGASEAARCWPAENFARLAEALSAAGFVPLLVGAPSDRDTCEKIAAAARVAIPNFAGRTTIPEMATLLARCDLLVSSDTGAAHLAAAVGTTVVGLYGATACFAETAPYGNNHLILQTPLNAPMSAISLEAAIAAALNRLDRVSTIDFRRELLHRNQSAWETSFQCPSSTSNGNPLGGLVYRSLHRDSLTADELLAQSLHEAFATEFVEPAAITTPKRLKISAIEPASEIGSAGKRTTYADNRQRCDDASLRQILAGMQILATLCAQSAQSRPASSEVAAAGQCLITIMEKLRASAAEPSWRRLSPVIHNLDWQLRMLPQQSPERTFRAHADAYASAARILRCAMRSATNVVNDSSKENETIDWSGSFATERREGGQVPHSVRIQAPARQRGSVSP
jgi:ADP-heptose:LPS heptosyltransferase